MAMPLQLKGMVHRAVGSVKEQQEQNKLCMPFAESPAHLNLNPQKKKKMATSGVSDPL